MKKRELIDIIALCENGGKNLWQTFSVIRQLRQIERRAASGSVTGYKVGAYDFACVNPQHFVFLVTEIFIAKPYYFVTDRHAPRIIDGGVNIGLSVAYFKDLFPAARIVGFEPHPLAYEVASRNVEHNKMSDVQLIQAALARTPGLIQLNFISNEIMASTTGSRLTIRGETPQVTSVRAVQLSEYLDEEVDFLKLDIEGAEEGVLEEAKSKLRQVRNLFVEFHLTRGDSTNSLPSVLQILEQSGFDYLITSTLSSRRSAAVSSLMSCGPVSSISIFAKRID